jgi:hypothetical protein
MKRHGTVRLLALLTLFSLPFFTGCGADDPVTPDPGPATAGLPFPGTENQLMANFRTTYEEMTVDTMADLLHADFTTILQPSTVQEFPDVVTTLD